MVKKVLVVDDELPIAQICKRVLMEEEYSVDTAKDGIEGKEKIQKRDYDLIILDVRMPLMNGKELYRYICDNHPEMKYRVIFNTGSVLGGNTTEFLKKSGRPFMLKPFTPDELKNEVRKLFAGE